jgi:hypothetical protein
MKGSITSASASLFASLLLTAAMSGQQTTTKAGTAQQTAMPVTMTECEGTNNCATWTFLGGQGNGQWPSGEVANLSVEKFDNDSVVIRRADSTGSAAGLTATYTGTRHGDRVGGEFTSSWPGHWNGKSGNWYATVEKMPEGLPRTMRFCGPAHCGTLTWKGGYYDAVYDDGQRGSKYTVQLFTREAVLINRVDDNGWKATLTGKISPEGNSIIDAKMISPDSDTASPYKLTWGTALSSAKGPTPQPRPQVAVVARPVVCYPWFFTIVCQ